MVNVPAMPLRLTNCAEPNSVLLTTKAAPETVALTPVASLTALMAVPIELTVVPLANESCSVPRLPATSIVTVAPVSVPPE